MKKHFTARPKHPTVAAEFVVSGVRQGDDVRFSWARGNAQGEPLTSLQACEKDALRHLRALPARPGL